MAIAILSFEDSQGGIRGLDQFWDMHAPQAGLQTYLGGRGVCNKITGGWMALYINKYGQNNQ